MADPIRMTDDDAVTLMRYGKESPEGKAALARLVQRLADWIDDEAAAYAYGEVARRNHETPSG